MKIILIALLAICVGAGILDSSETKNKRSTNEDDFQEKLKDGYDLLKNVPNADNTMKLLEQLHTMEEEIKDELIPEQNAILQNPINSYVQIQHDHIQPMGDSIEEVNHNSKVDTALFQGDMLLTKEQAEEVIADVRANKVNRHKRQAFRDQRYPKYVWSSGVRYSFSYNATEAAKRVFKKAAALWSQDTCINFGESNAGTDRIDLIQGQGCWSYVGKIGGVQALSLGQGCESVGTAAHEIGHALGLFHTQSRYDRDNFISLYTQNFLDGWLSQFTKQTEQTNYNYNLTYDYGSVMHYGATSVSKNGQPVMAPRDMKYLKTLGSAIISFYEKLMINLHYGCLDKCTGTSSARCENGGFPHPRDCSKCICPSGYGGRLCDERPRGCGNTLTATTSFQTLQDKVGVKDSRQTSDDFMMCHYWIQAPAGSTIEVVLDGYSDGMSVDGCRYAGVEIKTGKDKRYTGYRFCSSGDVGTRLVSTHNIVPVITYSNAYEATTVLRYRIASSGPEIPRTTARPTDRPTRRPTNTPNRACKDSSVCPRLMRWNFCRSPRYDDSLRRVVCPKSCGFC